MGSRKNKIPPSIRELRRRRPSLLQVQGSQCKHVVGLHFTVEWILGVNLTRYRHPSNYTNSNANEASELFM